VGGGKDGWGNKFFFGLAAAHRARAITVSAGNGQLGPSAANLVRLVVTAPISESLKGRIAIVNSSRHRASLKNR